MGTEIPAKIKCKGYVPLIDGSPMINFPILKLKNRHIYFENGIYHAELCFTECTFESGNTTLFRTIRDIKSVLG